MREIDRTTHTSGLGTGVIDYNGKGRWSRDQIVARYAAYADRYGIEPRDLSPLQSPGGRWVYPVISKVIEGIEAHDPACAEIGVEFIEESASFVFGRILKANTARALRRCRSLTPELEARIRKRVVEMLIAEYMPREFRQYAKLARVVGVREDVLRAQDALNFENPWVTHFVAVMTAEKPGDNAAN